MTATEIAATVSAVLADATLAEKVAMMRGHGFFESYRHTKRWAAEPYRAGGGCERPGVPALYFTDGPRGVAPGNSTCFPCTMVRGATFDPELERRVGEVMGIEARARAAPCRARPAARPRLGPAQDTYCEDPHHLG